MEAGVTFTENSKMFQSRFDSQSRLLIQALMSGSSGPHAARSVFRKQQRANPEISLVNLIETLCQDEITHPVMANKPLAVKPVVCQFSSLFKTNLLTFIYLMRSVLPETTILRLLKCFGQDSHPNPWVAALGRQLERKLELHHEQPLCTEQCSQRLKELSEGFGGTGGWAQCFNHQTENSESQSTSDLCEQGTQRKRRCSVVCLEDADVDELGQQSKRIKRDVCEDERIKNETQGGSESAAPAETPTVECLHDNLPENIKAAFLQIKELLESQTEWDENTTDVFKVLNESDPSQVKTLCSMLNLPDLPEHTLPKLCSSILSISPDLSHSTAATLIKGLLLKKVCSLSEPASRCLVTAAMSLCSRYPRPMCHAVIGPMLEDENIAFLQAELLNRLIESSLDSHYKLLVLQMTFKISWSEAVLSVIHSLLDSQLDLNEDVFTQFTEQLVSQTPQFIKSVRFAKMMLTVLTKYNSHVTAVHKNSLMSCLNLNETFLKKSLHAALKRITHA